MTTTADRLGVAMAYAARRAPVLDAEAKRTRFTSETARAANVIKHATQKPKTATVRVEADVVELVKCWPTSCRVKNISEAIRSAVRADQAPKNDL